MTEFIHSCGYHCRTPTCVLAQRDELVAKYVAQPAQPIAWMTEDGRVTTEATKQASMASTSRPSFNIPLFAAQQAEVRRVPLTPAQYNQIPELCAILPSLYESIVRAIEAAHGIKPATEVGAA